MAVIWILLIAFNLFLASWIHNDARIRGINTGAASLLGVSTFLTGLPIILPWLLFRPKTTSAQIAVSNEVEHKELKSDLPVEGDICIAQVYEISDYLVYVNLPGGKTSSLFRKELEDINALEVGNYVKVKIDSISYAGNISVVYVEIIHETELLPSNPTGSIEEMIPQLDKSNNEKKCHQCQAEIKISMVFCPHCGAKQVKVCSNCNRDISASDKFCGYCGTKVEE